MTVHMKGCIRVVVGCGDGLVCIHIQHLRKLVNENFTEHLHVLCCVIIVHGILIAAFTRKTVYLYHFG
jgi:hypothetical protein